MIPAYFYEYKTIRHDKSFTQLILIDLTVNNKPFLDLKKHNWFSPENLDKYNCLWFILIGIKQAHNINNLFGICICFTRSPHHTIFIFHQTQASATFLHLFHFFSDEFDSKAFHSAHSTVFITFSQNIFLMILQYLFYFFF